MRQEEMLMLVLGRGQGQGPRASPVLWTLLSPVFAPSTRRRPGPGLSSATTRWVPQGKPRPSLGLTAGGNLGPGAQTSLSLGPSSWKPCE